MGIVLMKTMDLDSCHHAHKSILNAVARRPDNTPDDNDRVEIGPTPLAFAEWKQAGLDCPDLQAMRRFRWQRMTEQVQKRGLGGVLICNPLNIRYVADVTNRQSSWTVQNPFRACLLLADGYLVLWEHESLDMFSTFNPLIKEVRSHDMLFHRITDTRVGDPARQLAAEINALLHEHAGANRRLAIDRIHIIRLRALEEVGIIVEEGEDLTEEARVIKGPDEIKAMKCAIHAGTQSIELMKRTVEPGKTEDEVWAELHHANISRGGSWMETRLLNSGPRTNPWMQECGPRIIQNKDMLAFDTDMIGCYGMCVDISRTWFVGDGKPSDEQKRLHEFALDHLNTNMALFKPGASFREITEKSQTPADEFLPQRYFCLAHGIGCCTESPTIKYKIDYEHSFYDGLIEPGMILCVEAYFGAVGGKEGVKLEDTILITENGYENLSAGVPFDERLSA